MLSEYRKLVYAGVRYNDNTLSFANLKSILLLQDFSKTFLTVCAFLSSFLFGLVFFFFFFFCESTHYEKQRKKTNKKNKKKKHKNINNLQTGRTNTLFCRSFFFRLLRENSVKSMCCLKIYIKVYLMHKTNHA